MERANYGAIARLQQNNWWYRGRRDLVDGILAARGPFDSCLDLGCGLGANFSTLDRHCRRWTGVDPSPEAVQFCREQGYDNVIQGDATELEADQDSFDLVTCLDVLEHLDDRAAVGEIRRVLAPGGLLVATVPAHRYLWNENDDFSRHLRRYERDELAGLLADFEEYDISYWNFSTFLPMLAYAFFRRLKSAGPSNNLDAVPGLANRPLTWALLAENRLRRRVWTPTGTSLVAIARAG